MRGARRKFWLMAASALAPLTLSLGISEPALAQTCTPVANPGTLTAGFPSTSCTGSFNTISFGGPTTPPPPLLTVTLQPGVSVTSSGGAAVNLFNTVGPTANGTSTTLNASGTAANPIVIDNTANPGGSNNWGLFMQSAGAAVINATNTQISVKGTDTNNGIWAISYESASASNVARVTYDAGATSGITSSGSNSTGIQAENRGIGNAVIDARGNISGVNGTTTADIIYGLLAHAGSNLGGGLGAPGDALVMYHSGTINVSGFFALGIFAEAGNGFGSAVNGSATVITDPGTTIIVNGFDPVLNTTFHTKAGIDAESTGTAAANSAITMNIASTIQSFGPADPDPSGRITNNGAAIRALAYFDAPIFIDYTGPGITTQCGSCVGILPLSRSGAITVNSSGPITTNGLGAFGIRADSGTLMNQLFGALPPGAGGPVTVNASAPITTFGDESHGIWASSTTGPVQATATNVSTTGQFSVGINAISAGLNGTGGSNVTVNVPAGGSVMGGWQADLTSVGPLTGSQAAGIFLSSAGGTATLTNNGSIGALSDRAVAGDPQVINNGLITGFVQFTGGNNSIINNNTFNLRHFADTNGDGVRDTLRVAIADLGAGSNNSFTNNGTLALPAVTGATTLDPTGQYLPLNNPNNSMALGGPLQGHLIGVSTFTNSGIIDLQSNPAAGDVLVITGGRTAGVPGTGTYISNGGTLKLDTVLNQGDAATRSDTLVVDGTSVGAGGATNMAIRNAGGAGALTVGDGILVVQVLDPTRSAAGAFSLTGAPITAGAFDYFLFHGGLSPGSTGNWYLRNTLAPGPTPAPGELLPTAVSGEIPLFQPEVALKSVVPSVARSLGLVTLGTFNEREGDQLLLRGDMRVGVWGRVFGQHTRENFAQGAQPDFDGTFAGFQAGADLLRWGNINGHSDRIGFYVGEGRATGSVHGLVDAFQGAPAGHLDIDATSYGGYWTHLGRSNWYIDAVLQGTYFQTSANSIRGDSNNFSGRGFAASIEAGYPIVLAPWLKFEPQIQGIWQRTSFDNTQAAFSTISFDRSDVFTGRAGALLRGTFGRLGVQWQPYLKGNVWWGSNGVDTVTFNGVGIPTGRNGGTTLEGGGGVTGKLTRYVSVYADASYLGSVSGETRNTLKGNTGLRVTW